MDISTNGLGETLISVYQEKLNQWSAWEFAFTDEDLPASFGLADDILRLEEGWEIFTAFIQSLQTEYLPEDLLTISEVSTFPDEPKPTSYRFVKEVSNYPFTIPDGTNLPGKNVVFLPDAEKLPAKNMTEEHSNITSPAGMQETLPQNLSENIFFEFPENPELPATDAISPPEDKIPNITSRHIPYPVREVDLTDLNKPNNVTWQHLPEIQAPQIPDQPGISSDSIWTNPLQNLANFATHFTYPLPKKNEDASSPPSKPLATYDANQPTTGVEESGLNKPGNQTSGSRSSAPEQLASSGSIFKSPPVSDQQELTSPVHKPIDLQAENQPFEPVASLHSPLINLDDVLEALTDHIVRDFRRYYP